ncbi:hypothetical protein BKA62DRAFT_772009 [Auriculariales sp. MPI-PUGE-AT-0066]|nr:hypothetical protein BKA62DRAFT_772009 [Auriculariales sp. MPI-PUGE-AT-0066]
MYSRILTAVFVLLAFAAFVAAKPVHAEVARTYQQGGLHAILDICINLQVQVHAIIKTIVDLGVYADVSVHIQKLVVCVNVAVKAIVSVCLDGGLDLNDKTTIRAIAEIIAEIILSIQACVGVIAKVAANVQACVALDLALKVLCLTIKVHATVIVDIVAKLCVAVDAHVNIVLVACLRLLGVLSS